MPRRLPSDRWQGVVRVGGRRVSPGHSFDLRRDAKAWEDEQRVRLRRGDWRDPKLARTLVEAWIARWMLARNIEPETAAAEARVIARHVLPRWHGMPVGAIGRLEVQSWVTGMTKAGVGYHTVSRAYGLFSAAMRAAADEDLIGRTPCRQISLPTKPAHRLAWWTPEEVGLIVARLSEPYATLAALMGWCGLRWEEAAGLGADGVDWLRREVHVTQVVTSGRRIKLYGKRVASHRVVPMAGPVAAMLQPAWDAAVAERGARGLVWEQDGRPLGNRTWGEHWRHRVRDGHQAGRRKPLELLPVVYYPPHVLRHSGASWLAQAGVPLADIGRWLGHEPGSKAVAIYAHLCPEGSNATISGALGKLDQSVDVIDRKGTAR